MGSRFVSAILAAGLSLGAYGAMAQSVSENQVAAMTDWSVFEHTEGDKRECWAVSTAKETVNTKEGRVVAVNRGDILLMVSYLPHMKVAGQIGFTGGYPFASGSNVSVDVDGNSFVLITEGEWAWPASSGDDASIIAAMKRGASAKLSARSSRGTRTEDTFSLLGFTAAVEDAQKRCK
ncbi:invasion associated locus B family protein [Shimia abyssi]|uniref:Invasion protein IalB n=1 Tax=Shimia abyssi TaxID=1662395 RepID=A0A2P8F4D2_9RHOB|nr:invasion associated locus B family protein [Shimia abyssi]PSL16574.1 hypothetical protein CLV88_12226 [Shimia abyssi]